MPLLPPQTKRANTARIHDARPPDPERREQPTPDPVVGVWLSTRVHANLERGGVWIAEDAPNHATAFPGALRLTHEELAKLIALYQSPVYQTVADIVDAIRQ